MCDGLPRWHSGKESACQCQRHRRCGFVPWVREIPGVGNGNPFQWQPSPIFLTGEFHGQRSLVGYSPCLKKVGHNWAPEHAGMHFCVIFIRHNIGQYYLFIYLIIYFLFFMGLVFMDFVAYLNSNSKPG